MKKVFSIVLMASAVIFVTTGVVAKDNGLYEKLKSKITTSLSGRQDTLVGEKKVQSATNAKAYRHMSQEERIAERKALAKDFDQMRNNK